MIKKKATACKATLKLFFPSPYVLLFLKLQGIPKKTSPERVGVVV